MSFNDSLKIRLTRIIPWDAGADLNTKSISGIEKGLLLLGWKTRHVKDYSRDGIAIYYYHTGSGVIVLDLFQDGFCIFSIHEPKITYNSQKDLDPLTLIANKTSCHRSILEGNHPITNQLTKTKQMIWKSIPGPLRNSASFNWESSGFSYVFSYFMITCNWRILSDSNFSKKLNTILFPIPSDEVAINRDMNQSKSLSDHIMRLESRMLEDSVIADFPHRKILFSWATSIMAGFLPQKVVFSYCRTMRELQHAWLAAYIGDRHLDYVVNDMSNIDNLNDLIDLDSQMSSIAREIGKFTSIPESTAHSVKLRTYKVASNQSGLNTLAHAIETKLHYIRAELNTRIQKRNWRGYKTIEITLTLLTLLQAISAYKSIQQTGGLSLIEYFTIFLLVLILLVFFHRR